MAKTMIVESGVDRISALPDELLTHILSFVPTKMAVCTSVLSTRWRCLYSLVPSLDFVTDGDADDVEKANRFMKFVERVLLFRTKPVKRFRLIHHHDIDHSQMDGWVRALIWRNIQELVLYNAYSPQEKVRLCNLQLPASLFSCKTLVALKLNNIFKLNRLEIPGSVSLPNLKVLHIRKTLIPCDSVERLVTGCLVLDDLVLDGCFPGMINTPPKLNISKATLKRLTITPSILLVPKHSFQIVINSPALVYFNIALFKMSSVVLEAAESLVKVVIDGISRHPPNHVNTHDVLRQITITNVQSLRMQHHIIQGLFDHKLPLPLFDKLTYLKVSDWGCVFDYHFLEYLLTPCVVLETLVFEQRTKKRSYTQSTRIQSLLPQSQPTNMLSHLTKVEIQLVEVEDAEAEALLKIIEFFLITAKVLEKLSVRVKQFSETQQLKILREVTTLPRVSKKCRVFVDKLS